MPKKTAKPKQTAKPQKATKAKVSAKTSKIATPKEATKAKAPAKTPNAFAPFLVMEYTHKPGLFGLLLTDRVMFDAHIDATIEKSGRINNGYTWGAIADHLMTHEAPAIARHIRLDCEAGMFAANSEDGDALRHLAGLLRDAFHDPSRLAELLSHAEAD